MDPRPPDPSLSYSRPLGVFGIVLGVLAGGWGLCSWAAISVQRAVFSKLDELGGAPPSFLDMVALLEAFERLSLIHLPIMLVGGGLLIVFGVRMRLPDPTRARRATAWTMALACLGAVEVGAYMYGVTALVLRSGWMGAIPSDMPIDMEVWARLSGVINFLFMVSPPTALAVLTGRALVRTRPSTP